LNLLGFCYRILLVVLLNTYVKTRNTKENIPMTINSFVRFSNPILNKTIFFSIELEITRGLSDANFIRFLEIFSNGRRVFEKNINIAEKITEAKIIVSSDLKRYPRNIPIKINTVRDANRADNNSRGIVKIFIFRINQMPPKTIRN